MKTISRTFHLYRYQILPTKGQLQLTNLEDQIDQEDLISKKNDIFAKVLREIKEFYHPRAELTHHLYEYGDFLVIQLGANRSLIRITKEFEEEELENWPSVYTLINNSPDVQLMAVELELRAFYRTSTVINVLETNINSKLSKYNLEVQILPTFEKNEFWRIVKSHKNRIKSVDFYMVAPNLAKISQGLELDLGELKNRTNSIKTNLSLNSPKKEGLTLSEDDHYIQSLVGYSSEGGGTIHIKVANVKKKIKTEDSIKSIEIDEIHFYGEDAAKDLVKVFRELMK